MGCCHYHEAIVGADNAFAVDVAAITFGRGTMSELGAEARRLGLRRVALFTDPRIRALPPFATALASLREAGVDVEIFDEVSIEPTNASFAHAIEFATRLAPDGYLSIGGGSVIDTAKAANLYATHPAPLRRYVNAPVGEGQPVPGPLKPHIACPTTSGTGSECTGIAIFDDLDLQAKTGIASRALRPTRALIDPDWTGHLPEQVLACSAFDVLSHALESYTARRYCARPQAPGGERPLSQGANPWSDLGCAEALRLAGRYLVRAVRDASDREAREQLLWASTLAGIAFGNSGVHVPHGMSYAVAGLAHDHQVPGYPGAMIPHGLSVILNAPAVFEHTAAAALAAADESLLERHLEAARWLSPAEASTADAAPADAGEVLGKRLRTLMRDAGLPRGLAAVGYGREDVPSLTAGTIVQRRLLDNAPVPIDETLLQRLFERALAA